MLAVPALGGRAVASVRLLSRGAMLAHRVNVGRVLAGQAVGALGVVGLRLLPGRTDHTYRVAHPAGPTSPQRAILTRCSARGRLTACRAAHALRVGASSAGRALLAAAPGHALRGFLEPVRAGTPGGCGVVPTRNAGGVVMVGVLQNSAGVACAVAGRDRPLLNRKERHCFREEEALF